MRYEQLKPGTIFAAQVGIYIRADFGHAVDLHTGKTVVFKAWELVEKRCCATCRSYRNGKCTDMVSGKLAIAVEPLNGCEEWEGLI